MGPAADDYFGDELRGYRLLKSVGISHAERQQVLTLTGNRVNFEDLRGLFDSGADSQRHRQRSRAAWWAAADAGDLHYQDFAEEEFGDDGDHGGYEDEGVHYRTAGGWDDPGSYYEPGDYTEYPEYGDQWAYHQEEAYPAFDDPDAAFGQGGGDEHITEEEVEMVKQEADASLLAAEASRTLAEARAAVAKVRAARGYYAPSKGQAPKGGPKGKGGSSRCLVCGQSGHWFRDCPQRFGGGGKGAAGKGPGKSFSKGKGKPKCKKGGDFRAQFHYMGTFVIETVGVLHTEEAADFGSNDSPQFILDTGATECAAGVETIQKLISQAQLRYTMNMEDRPTFRFGGRAHLES